MVASVQVAVGGEGGKGEWRNRGEARGEAKGDIRGGGSAQGRFARAFSRRLVLLPLPFSGTSPSTVALVNVEAATSPAREDNVGCPKTWCDAALDLVALTAVVG